MISGVIFFLLAANAAVVFSEGLPKSLVEVMTVLSGKFSNYAQMIADKKHHEKTPHDEYDFTFVPVQVPATFPKPTFFYEDVVNGKIIRLELLVFSQDDNGIIKIQPYNITDMTKYTPGSYDLGNLENLKPEDLQTRPECEIKLMAVESDVFFGEWPDCRRYMAEKIPIHYTPLITCHAFSGFVSEYSGEVYTTTPYEMFNLNVRYPLLPYMLNGVKDFENPCDKEYS